MLPLFQTFDGFQRASTIATLSVLLLAVTGRIVFNVTEIPGDSGFGAAVYLALLILPVLVLVWLGSIALLSRFLVGTTRLLGGTADGPQTLRALVWAVMPWALLVVPGLFFASARIDNLELGTPIPAGWDVARPALELVVFAASLFRLVAGVSRANGWTVLRTLVALAITPVNVALWLAGVVAASWLASTLFV